jgi:ornithine carbamoyltransferase
MTATAPAIRPASAGTVRHFLTLDDLGPHGLQEMLDLTRRLKREPDAFRGRLAGGRVGMIFDKPSTRTRVSFESAAWMLGMLPVVLRPDELQLGRGETVADTARALSLCGPSRRPRSGSSRRPPRSRSSTRSRTSTIRVRRWPMS